MNEENAEGENTWTRERKARILSPFSNVRELYPIPPSFVRAHKIAETTSKRITAAVMPQYCSAKHVVLIDGHVSRTAVKANNECKPNVFLEVFLLCIIFILIYGYDKMVIVFLIGVTKKWNFFLSSRHMLEVLIRRL